MVVNVYNSNTGYLQSAFVFAGTTGPEIANPRCFAAGFWNERRINGYCLATAFKVFSDDGFIEGKPVKVIILKIVAVCLFRETSDLLIFTADSRAFLHSDWYCIRSDSLVIIKSGEVLLIY